MNVVDGRNFSPEYPGDSTAIVVNEAVVRAFNLEKPIGTRLQTFVYDPETGETKSDEFNTYTIIGVIEDFHFNTMHKAISPLILSLGTNAGYMAVRFNSSDTEEVIQLAQNEWNDLNPGAPFSYTFMSDEFSTMYRTEQRLGRIFSIFAGLAILIGCLGLFGLATYLTEQRVKEIGIRKVLGASNNKIILLLSQDFGKLILIAIFISVPLAWLMIREWLVSFEYRTKIGWEVYVIVAFIAIFIAAVSILYQSIKAALSNPAETIRSE
jgi:putative ABC transport system permease protein